MATPTPTRPGSPEPDDSGTPARGSLAARVFLGSLFRPVAGEFLLIASAAVLLTIFGLIMVLSATSATASAAGREPYDAVLKQAMFAAVGLPLMFIASRMPLRFWKRIAWPALILATAFQLLVFTPLGVEDGGNRNWIMIAGVQAQPSEFLKLALALWLGFILYRKRTLLGDWRHVFIPVVPVAAAVIATVLAGHDLGTATVLFLLALGALFFSGVKLRVFLIPVILAVVAVAGLAVTSDNRMTRILSVFDTNCATDYLGTCYQPLHGIWALAGGGIFGLGLGNSKEKYEWLPAASSDYIFAIVGEELGLVGAVVVLALFAVYAIGAFHIVRRTNDTFVRIVAGAIAVWIVGQALINVGVVLRLLPPLGVPLPFMSQGGTSLVSVLLATGVLLSLARTLPDRITGRPAPRAAR